MRTEPGEGTAVELLIPFSIASFHALVVEVGGAGAAVPLEAIRRTLRVAPEEIVGTAQGDWIVHEGQSIPFASLLRIVRPWEPQERLARTTSAFIVEAGGAAATFAVDRIVGASTMVMRPLPELVPAMASVAGAALDPGGDPRLVLDAASLVREAQRLGSPAAAPAAARRSILVIDDSLTTRMLEQSILESAGYEVSLASSAEEGLEKARAGTYSLFLVDVEMPGMDGFTFIDQTRADPVLRATPSILVTSRASADDQRRGREVGAQGYVVKSDFDQGALLEQIRALVQ
jgi:two-component system chemotaxis sensor kinase CheA